MVETVYTELDLHAPKAYRFPIHIVSPVSPSIVVNRLNDRVA